ncbi:MAG: putative bifunctional diguanylate cyclase/phosphodiesterase [Acidimicrobiales bacterium]
MLLAGTAGLLVAAQAAHLGAVRHVASAPLTFAALVVVSAAVLLAPVSFHHRGDTHLVGLTEVPLLLGLVFASPLVLVLARVAGEVIVLGFVRRQTPLKLFFNLTVGACGAALAAIVYHAALGHRLPVSPLGSAAGAAALAAAAITADLAVRAVVRLNGRQVPRRSGFQFTTEAMLLAASIGLAFVVLDASWWNWWAVIPLVLVGVLIIVAYRGYLRLTERFSALQRLYDFSRSLGRANLEPASTASTVLEQIQAVMRARRAELVLVDGAGGPLRVRFGAEGLLSETVSLSEDSIATRVIKSGKPMLCVSPAQSTPSSIASDPIFGEFRSGVSAPLRYGDVVAGALVALDREEELDPFDADDLRLFETLVAHAGSSIERARLVEELRHEGEARLYQATHDQLTGLANRVLFLAEAKTALQGTDRAAVVLLDIDRFKDVNDTLGHETGDRLLCEVSRRLVQGARGRATVARLGGDEFALLVSDVIGPEEAIGVVRDLDVELSRPISLDELTLAITASAGIALAPENGKNVADLLQRADIAMYRAKERRTGIELYSVVQDRDMQRRLMLAGGLAHALEDGDQLSVVYQPIADLSTGKVLRVEALARWEHPEEGWIPAQEFIGIADQMGLIRQVTEYVLAEACAQAATWRRNGLLIGLAVNVSGRELSDEGLVELVQRELQRNELPASALTLELTETEVTSDIGEASAVLARLARLGVRIAVDDYGTGYSSLAYLHHLPVQELKIDRSFVTNMAEDPSNRIIVRSSIAMAKALGLTVVAEGAEHEVTCAILADAGCDSVQGDYFSRPRTGADLQEWFLSGARLSFSPELPPMRPLRVVGGGPGRPPNSESDSRQLGR